MSRTEINQMTRREWRELGFFYDRNDEIKEWRLQGSKNGLRQFATALRHYAANPARSVASEHEHFGPYQYLKIGTWMSPDISAHWIAGELDDLQKLSQLVESHLLAACTGDCVALRETFAPRASYDLVMEVREDDFDPAMADDACW